MVVATKSTKALLKIGVIGSVITAICCFTPALVVLLGAFGLDAVIGYLDYLLFPALAVFVGITVYAMAKKRREACCGEMYPSGQQPARDRLGEKALKEE